MSHVMPQVALHRVIETGMRYLRDNPKKLDQIFGYYVQPEMGDEYGTDYVEDIKKWFLKTKIPVVQAWSFNPQQMPQISIKLANEQEDEQKAAIGDHFGMDYGEDATVGVGTFTVFLDIGIHSSRNGDQILWLYTLINYILFQFKDLARGLGLQLTTFSATDYSKPGQYMANNIWTRWIKYRATCENLWYAEDINKIDLIKYGVAIEPSNDKNNTNEPKKVEPSNVEGGIIAEDHSGDRVRIL